MNSNVMHSRVQVEPTLLKQLVSEVKETVATGINMPTTSKSNSFKAINLWGIQKRGRYVNYGTSRKKNLALSLTHVSI
ncbi:MAG: hypothetical protein QM726_14975 [Chitinophagaceae bacterium]